MKPDYDLLILGAGCAGLSLANALRRQGSALDFPRIAVIESGEAFASNKTWGFWHPREVAPQVPIGASFEEWSFSLPGVEPVRHQSERWRYAVVEGAPFFRATGQAVLADPRVEVRMRCPVVEVRETPGAIRVVTAGGDYLSRYVIDTRSPERSHLEQSRLFQVFLGAEVRIPQAVGPRSVALMENMESDSLGFRFDYVVPLSNDRILVEATRFSVHPLGPETLESDLQATLKRYLPGEGAQVERKEWGMIPMGLPVERSRHKAHWVRAGARGGAVRASSGYAFAEIQDWAWKCAAKVLNGKAPIEHPARARALQWMDALFLEVLRAEPERAPDLFWRIARTVPADSFVRFMIGRASSADMFTVIRALPPRPFLRQLCRA